jgi:hypothetical protein
MINLTQDNLENTIKYNHPQELYNNQNFNTSTNIYNNQNLDNINILLTNVKNILV